MARTKHVTTNAQIQKSLQKATHALDTALTSRSQYAQQLGMSFGTDRDLYAALGYKRGLSFSDYWNRFSRQDIATRIVRAFPDSTWRAIPEVFQDEDDNQTEGEKVWEDLLHEIDVYHYLQRADILAGIGQFSIVVVGFDDGNELSQPVIQGSATKVLYMQPRRQDHVTVKTWSTDEADPRYGLPEMYEVELDITATSTEDSKKAKKQTLKQSIHFTRVLHIADLTLESDVFGTPRLESVTNRLEDMARVSGGSAEMFWRGAFEGIAFQLKDDATLDPQDKDDLEDEIEDYFQKLNRYMILQNMEAKSLAPSISSPKDPIDMLLKLISGATGIPMRILTGSERGELASTQDKTNWDERIDERRKTFAGPRVLHPFIDMLVFAGVLPEDEAKPYQIRWPDPSSMSAQTSAEIAEKQTKAMSEYVRWGLDMIMSPIDFYTKVLGFAQEEAEGIDKNAMEFQTEEDKELEVKDENGVVVQHKHDQKSRRTK